MYIYNNLDWPQFRWNHDLINRALIKVKFEQGRILGKMQQLGFELQEKTVLETLTHEVVKSSSIEGEVLDSDEVRSSIARHLGLDIAGLKPSDRHVDGIVEVLLDATRHFDQPLSLQRLCQWHNLLFPFGMSGMMLIIPGMLRQDSEGPMQVVSGHYGKEKVHFKAPPANKLENEMALFIEWFNHTQTNLDPIVKAAIAHLWLVTLHPFEDGNGRITRALTDMQLARSENEKNRFYSMSTQIRKQRKTYYNILERTQKGTLDISEWLIWFLNCLYQSIIESETLTENILNKAKFWEAHACKTLNERQITILNLLFDGFEGKLTSNKWAKIMKCSQDTASRDIKSLLEYEILIKSPKSGRSTSYHLKDYPINTINHRKER